MNYLDFFLKKLLIIDCNRVKFLSFLNDRKDIFNWYLYLEVDYFFE